MKHKAGSGQEAAPCFWYSHIIDAIIFLLV